MHVPKAFLAEDYVVNFFYAAPDDGVYSTVTLVCDHKQGSNGTVSPLGTFILGQVLFKRGFGF